MKLAVLVALAFAGVLILLGVHAMDRKGESVDVAVGGAILVLFGLVLGAATLASAVVYVFAKV